MDEVKRDPTKVDPLTGAEEPERTPALDTVPPGEPANATNAVIPGTGTIVKDVEGNEAKRVVRT